jgi:hypothetical protein
MEPILREAREQLHFLEEDSTLTPIQKALERIDIRETFESKMVTVLTPGQQKKWNSLRQQAVPRLLDNRQPAPQAN